MITSLIAAVDLNRLIGANNDLPWHLPADLKRFKNLTMGHPLIMGRRTHESIGKPLPGRTNIVLTRQSTYEASGCQIARDPEEALVIARRENAEEVMVIGGASVYEAFLPRADRLYLTVVHHRFEGNTYFPELRAEEWETVSVEDVKPDEKNPWPHSLYVLERTDSTPFRRDESPSASRYPRPPFLSTDDSS